MLDGQLDERPAPEIRLSELSFGALRMANGLTRLETRFLGDEKSLENARKLVGTDLDAQAALDAGLITYAPDDIDWEDEIRLLLEERASFHQMRSPAWKRTCASPGRKLWRPRFSAA